MLNVSGIIKIHKDLFYPGMAIQNLIIKLLLDIMEDLAKMLRFLRLTKKLCKSANKEEVIDKFMR